MNDQDESQEITAEEEFTQLRREYAATPPEELEDAIAIQYGGNGGDYYIGGSEEVLAKVKANLSLNLPAVLALAHSAQTGDMLNDDPWVSETDRSEDGYRRPRARLFGRSTK